MVEPYYQDQYATIYHGDCLELLPEMPKVDLVLTDCLYGVTQNNWDNFEITKKCFDFLMPCRLVTTCQNPATARIITRFEKYFKWSDVWHKSQAVGFLNAKIMPMREHEDIICFANGENVFNPQISKKKDFNIRPHGNTKQSNCYGKFKEERKRTIAQDESYPRSVVRFNNSQNGFHENEKPLGLFYYLVASFSNTDEVILDPFGGSCTTAVAAKKLNRKCIIIEIEEKYCEIGAKRLSQEVLDLV